MIRIFKLKLRQTKLLVIAICLFALLGSVDSLAADERPNIVFVLSDDHRWDQLGCAGHPILKTPNLDQLAQDGIRFRNMFVTTSICAASRASIFTGMYERGHRFTFGTKPLAAEFIDSSYPVTLRKAGYQTGFVGKFGVSIEGDVKRMWDYYGQVGRNPYFKKQKDGTLRHATQITGDKAIEFLEQQESGKPFCLSVSFNAPHAEDSDKENHYPVPKSVAGMYDDVEVPPARLSEPEIFKQHPEFLKNSMLRTRYHWRWDTKEKYVKNMRGYWGMVSGVDHVVGRIRKAIEDLGFADNTVIIFTGDNGYYLGQRGFAGKWSHHEESLRVPLIVLDPRQKPATKNATIDNVVLNVDIAPTIQTLAGLKPPKESQGRSLEKLLQGDSVSDWRTDFFCEHLFHIPGQIPKYEGVRGPRWTYARYFEQSPPFEYLHDLQSDPDQLKNLALDDKYTAELEKMRNRCNELREQLGGEYSREKFPRRTD